MACDRCGRPLDGSPQRPYCRSCGARDPWPEDPAGPIPRATGGRIAGGIALIIFGLVLIGHGALLAIVSTIPLGFIIYESQKGVSADGALAFAFFGRARPAHEPVSVR